MSVLHSQLRNKCSGLNSDHLCDLCDVVEDTSNYFFQCRKYSVERKMFNDTVRGFQPLNINVILNGNGNRNGGTCMVLFRAVYKYMISCFTHASKRFDNLLWLCFKTHLETSAR